MQYKLHICMGIIAFILFAISCASPVQPGQPAPTPAPATPAAPTATASVLEISRVTNDNVAAIDPRPAPNGRSVLFTVVDRGKTMVPTDPNPGGILYSIVQVELSGVGRRLVAGPYAATPAWCPAGDTYVYVYLRGARQQLVKSPTNGVGMTFVTPGPMGERDQLPDVSPDGQKIAFTTLIGDQPLLCTVGIDGSNFTTYVQGYAPRWSPDGTKIAFHTGVPPHVFSFDLKSGQVTQLTSGSSADIHPAWSPDGAWLTFVSNRDGKSHLYAMKSNGSAVTQLTRGESRESLPSWSSDGFVYFCSDAGAPTPQGDDPWLWTFSNVWRLKTTLVAANGAPAGSIQ